MDGPAGPRRILEIPGGLPPEDQQWACCCLFCGFENPIGGDVCENCGAELSMGTPEPPESFEGRLLGTRLGELGAGQPLRIDLTTDAFEAVARMKEASTDCVLVTDGNRLAGIFTDRDAMVKLTTLRAPGPPLAEVMTPDPEVLLPGDTVAMAIHTMAVGRLRHVPLVHPDGSVTVVAARDLFRHLSADRS